MSLMKGSGYKIGVFLSTIFWNIYCNNSYLDRNFNLYKFYMFITRNS